MPSMSQTSALPKSSTNLSPDGEMFTCERHAGRVVEMRLWSKIDESGLRKLKTAVAWQILKLRRRSISVIDLRQAEVFKPAVADKLIEMMSRNSILLERSAVILNDDPVLEMQARRALRATGDDRRQVFAEPEDAIRWLEEILTEEEKARLHVFLDLDPISEER